MIITVVVGVVAMFWFLMFIIIMADLLFITAVALLMTGSVAVQADVTVITAIVY